MPGLHLGLSLLTLFPGRVGGSETNVRGLLEQYAVGNGPEQVTVLANRQVRDAYHDVAVGAVKLRHVRSYRAGDSDITRFAAMQVARIAPALAARDVPGALDVVHFPVTIPIPRVAAPRVVTLFDVQHHDMPHLFSRMERRFRRWAYDGAARSAALVLTSSSYSKQSLVEHVGLDEARVEVIPLGIDHDRFHPEGCDDETLLAGLDLPARFVVYPANLWPHKNHGRLLEALSRVNDRELALVLTGRRDDRWPVLLRQAHALGLGDRVHHLGYVEGRRVPAVYRRAVGMVFPSLFEGFGSPPLEAMACGCPVASSTAASLGEVCADAALAFDPADSDSITHAIERLASDAELRARLRNAGMARAAAYTWELAARAHVSAYRRALAQ